MQRSLLLERQRAHCQGGHHVLIPQLGSALRERTAAKAIADGARYLLHEDSEQVLFIGKTNQMKPLIDLIVLTNMRLVGISLSHPAESPKVQAWWPQVRLFSFSEKWSSKNRLTVLTHEGSEIPFGTVREADVPYIRAQIEQLTSPAHSGVVLRTLTARRDREAARLREKEHQTREWLRYQEADAPPVSPPGRTAPTLPPAAADHDPRPPVPTASTFTTPAREVSPLVRPQSQEPPSVRPNLASSPDGLQDHLAEPKPSTQLEQSVQASEKQTAEAPENGEAGPAVVPVSERSFLAEFAEARKKPRKWPYLLLVCEIAGIAMRGSGWIVMAMGFVIAVIVASVENNNLRPRVDYELTGDEASKFEEVVTAFREMAKAGRSWLVTEKQRVESGYERKTNAGAGVKTTRVSASVSFSGLSKIVTDVEVPTLAAGPWMLHFYPDRFLIGNSGRFTEHRYEELRASADVTRFVESSTLPSDAVVVDHTWTYVNVRGGPDRRYKDNRKLPIALYGELTLYTGDVKLHWMVSHADVPKRLRKVLRKIGVK
ncbi:hypothetical protein ABT352_36210 [Streptosporangium sp. NPDC000563]|uniref:hypothetical protein n=1 Tax=Streptosporangium sp. NPDC000563 TaxID=3154366 RepID=UPI003333D605